MPLKGIMRDEENVTLCAVAFLSLIIPFNVTIVLKTS